MSASFPPTDSDRDGTVERLSAERPRPDPEFADRLRARLATEGPIDSGPEVRTRVRIYAASAFGLLGIVALDLTGLVRVAGF